MGNKLCVSTSAFAFAFDVLKEKWERCELFAGFYRRLAMKGDEDYEDSEIGDLNGDKDFEGDKGIGGEDLEDEDDKELLPFGFEFDKRACLFDEDILVGYVFGAESFMAAYQIVDGKAVRRQVLDNLNLNPFYRHYLLSLGNGLFCLTYFNDDKEDDLDDEETCVPFSLVLFKLSRATAVMANDDSGSKFVNCELLKKLTWKIDQKSAYSPIYSFVMRANLIFYLILKKGDSILSIF
ncbi:unnamed protein product [Coffea canephora]|uniref:Uncharacterized protein n=1 Tax=Coffea canephora TaxID=49390 RepID=A0A068UUU7_COFCA|nr:unnamed protein product [Coffea canephora]